MAALRFHPAHKKSTGEDAMKIIVGKAMTRAAAGLAALMLVGASQGTSQGASKAENGARRISDEASPHHRALSPHSTLKYEFR